MSIIAAFDCGIGTILCADSQETVGSYAKRRVEKISVHWKQDSEFSIAIGAAGSGHYADMLTFDLRYAITNTFIEYDPEKIIQFIQQKLVAFYVAHDLPRGEGVVPWNC